MVIVHEHKSSKKNLHERILDPKREFLPKLVGLANSGFTLFDAYGIGVPHAPDALFQGGDWKVMHGGGLYKFFNNKTQSYVKLFHGDIRGIHTTEGSERPCLVITYTDNFTFFFRFRNKEAITYFLEG